MVELDDAKAADLESLQDEIYSRLANRYGLSKGEIAKLALKRYGGEIMTEKTEEILSNVRGVVGGGGDVMDKMMTWEMIKDMRSQRATQPQAVQNQQPQLQQPAPQQGMPSFQEMFMMFMMPQMMKAMSGGEDDMMKMYKMHQMRQLMEGGGDGKGMDMEKLEQMMAEERRLADARTEQMMDMMLGRQQAEKIRETEEKRRKELEDRIQRAEYLAQHPTQPQEPFQSARDKLDESLGMMTDMKSKMQDAGMVQRPESPEDKAFELDKMGIGHKQGIETEAVKQLAKSADKLADTADKTTNKVIDFIAEEQQVKARQMELMNPEERKKMEAQYKYLANQVSPEEGVEAPATSEGSLDLTDEDDLDAADE